MLDNFCFRVRWGAEMIEKVAFVLFDWFLNGKNTLDEDQLGLALPGTAGRRRRRG